MNVRSRCATLCALTLAAGASGAFDRDDYRQERDVLEDRRDLGEQRVRETRSADTQTGAVRLDAAGRRVRFESQFLRPAANRLEYRFYTRRDGRTDSAIIQKTFSSNLPADLGPLRYDVFLFLPDLIDWQWSCNRGDSACYDQRFQNPSNPDGMIFSVDGGEAWATDIDVTMTQGTDVYRERLTGGESFRAVMDFDHIAYRNFDLSVNGNSKVRWTRTGGQANAVNLDLGTVTKYFPDAAGVLSSTPADRPTVTSQLPANIGDGPPAATRTRFDFKDGTFIEWRGLWMDAQGNHVFPRTNFVDASDVIHGYFDANITASEFGGRDIDVLFAPVQPLYGLPLGYSTWSHFP
jgi:hypothetical protein